jgi:hypothetical protein
MPSKGRLQVLPELLGQLASIRHTQTSQLVAGLAASGALNVLFSGCALAAFPALAQRVIVIAILWPLLEPPLSVCLLIASLAVATVYLLTELRLHANHIVTQRRIDCSAVDKTGLPFAALTAALALLIAHGLTSKYTSSPYPPTVTLSIISLVVNGLLLMLMARSPQSVGLGVLMLADAGRVLYAFLGADLLVWCTWAASDVIVALASAHLRNLQAQAMAGRTEGKAG